MLPGCAGAFDEDPALFAPRSNEGVVTMVEGTLRPDGSVLVELLTARPATGWDLLRETRVNCTLVGVPGQNQRIVGSSRGEGGAWAVGHTFGPRRVTNCQAGACQPARVLELAIENYCGYYRSVSLSTNPWGLEKICYSGFFVTKDVFSH